MMEEKEWYCGHCDMVTHKDGLYPPLCKRCGILCVEAGDDVK